MAAALRALVARWLLPPTAPAAAGAPSAAPERRRRASCEYHADAWGDRLVGYDGARREAWLVRLDAGGGDGRAAFLPAP